MTPSALTQSTAGVTQLGATYSAVVTLAEFEQLGHQCQLERDK